MTSCLAAYNAYHATLTSPYLAKYAGNVGGGFLLADVIRIGATTRHIPSSIHQQQRSICTSCGGTVDSEISNTRQSLVICY